MWFLVFDFGLYSYADMRVHPTVCDRAQPLLSSLLPPPSTPFLSSFPLLPHAPPSASTPPAPPSQPLTPASALSCLFSHPLPPHFLLYCPEIAGSLVQKYPVPSPILLLSRLTESALRQSLLAPPCASGSV
eukprot:3219822-Rhodomonas_salina.2